MSIYSYFWIKAITFMRIYYVTLHLSSTCLFFCVGFVILLFPFAERHHNPKKVDWNGLEPLLASRLSLTLRVGIPATHAQPILKTWAILTAFFGIGLDY